MEQELIKAGIPADRAAKYAVSFEEQGLDKMADLALVTDAELKECGMTVLGDRAKLRRVLKGGGGASTTDLGRSPAPAPAPRAAVATRSQPSFGAGPSSASAGVLGPSGGGGGRPAKVHSATTANLPPKTDSGQNVYKIGGGRDNLTEETRAQVNELEVVILQGENLVAKDKKKLSDPLCAVVMLDEKGAPIKETTQKTFKCLRTVNPDWSAEASSHREKSNMFNFSIDQNRKRISGVQLTITDANSKSFLGEVRLSYQDILTISASNNPAWRDLQQRSSKDKVSGRIQFRLKYYAAGTRGLDEATEKVVRNIMSSKGMPPLNIVILIVGSRGDVQPFVSFSLGLKALGHNVRICSHTKFLNFVRGQGLDYYPLRGDPETLMKFMSEHPDMMATDPKDIAAQTNTLKEIFDSVYLACTTPTRRSGNATFVPDVIISNPPVAVHVHTAEKLHIPLQIMFTMPWSTTKDYRHPFACFGPMKLIKGNRESYAHIDRLIWTGQAPIINKYRNSIGLPSIVNGLVIIEKLRVPQTYCMSPHLAAKPTDWGPHIDVVGFWFLDLTSSFNPREKVPALVDFLEAGPKPFYIGFGSIVVENPKKLSKLVIQAIENARSPDGQPVRAIVHQGWARLGEGLETSENIFLLDKPVPHDWLFPLCSSCCHHGGAGTMAAGLRVGLPTIVVPFFGDQPFWGNVVAAKGVGPDPIFNTEISHKKLKEAIEFCYKPEVVGAAEALGKLLMNEDGVGSGCDAFLRKVPAAHGKFMVELWENQRRVGGGKKKEEDKVIDVRSASKKEKKKMEKAALGLDSEWRACKQEAITAGEALSMLGGPSEGEEELVSVANYSDKSMIQKRAFDDFPLPPGWKWDGPWKLDINYHTDEKGWLYNRKLMAFTGWSKEPAHSHFRRRRHIRFRSPIPGYQAEPLPPFNELNETHPVTMFIKLEEMENVKIKNVFILMCVHRFEAVYDGTGALATKKEVNKIQTSRSKIFDSLSKGHADVHQTFYMQFLAGDHVELRLCEWGMTGDSDIGSVVLPAREYLANANQKMEIDFSTGKPKCKGKVIMTPTFFETPEEF